MDAEDLIDLLEKAGLDLDKLKDALEELDDDASVEDVLEKIGRAIGKFGGGVASGATGLDSSLIRTLLDIFGPLAQSTLGRLIDELMDENQKDFETRKPGPSNTKRERISQSGWVDDHAPDLRIQSTPTPVCHGAGMICVPIKGRIKYREEVVDYISVTFYDKNNRPFADEDDDFEANTKPKLSDVVDDANNNKGKWKTFTTYLLIPCHKAIQAGGELTVQISVMDGDGNYMTDFRSVSFAEILLNDKYECCKTFRENGLKETLLEVIKEAMKADGLTIGDLIKEITARPEGKEKDAKPSEKSGKVKTEKPDEKDASADKKPDGKKEDEKEASEASKDEKGDKK